MPLTSEGMRSLEAVAAEVEVEVERVHRSPTLQFPLNHLIHPLPPPRRLE
jgi:hypothetical protein